jgi:hypothetical protein
VVAAFRKLLREKLCFGILKPSALKTLELIKVGGPSQSAQKGNKFHLPRTREAEAASKAKFQIPDFGK